MLNEKHQALHERAVRCAKSLLKHEAELIEIILEVDREKLFRLLGYNSLFDYVVKALHISPGSAYGFTAVAKKSVTVPELKQAIDQGELNVNTARKIVSVITAENSQDWIGKATKLSQRELEKEIVAENPKKHAVKEKITPVARNLSEFRCSMTDAQEKLIRRVQDLESQRTKKACSLQEALVAMTAAYLDRRDPVRKAARVLSARKKRTIRTAASKPHHGKRKKMRAGLIHEVNLRDQGRCSEIDPSGKRCEQSRWIEMHHRIPVAEGGTDELQNLTSLCFHHHRALHGTPLRTQAP